MTVTASDAAGNTSAASSALNVTTATPADTEAPSVVTGLASSNVTETSFDLSWSASTDNVGVVSYEIFQDGVSIGTTGATTLSVSGLSASTTYAMTVTASDAAGNTSAASSALNVTTADPTPVAAALYFSEYIEGSSNNKGLEIANSTGATVDLTGYSVARQVNGAGAWDTPVNLSGTLADGDVYVIVNSSADALMQAVADLATGATAMTFNGDDPVGLFFNGQLLDVIGDFNVVATFAQDVTLRRNDNITAGNTTYTTSEWTSFATDTFNGLGERITSGPVVPDAITNTLSMFTIKKGPNTKGYADVVVTSNGSPVANALVEITWSGAENGTSSGYTDASGFVGFVSNGVKGSGSFTVTITNITATNYAWDAANSTTSGSISFREVAAATLVEGEVALYPNPAVAETTLQLAAAQEGTLTVVVYNTQGQALRTVELNAPAGTSRHTLHLEGLKAGMYLVRVQGASTQQTLRLLVK